MGLGRVTQKGKTAKAGAGRGEISLQTTYLHFDNASPSSADVVGRWATPARVVY